MINGTQTIRTHEASPLEKEVGEGMNLAVARSSLRASAPTDRFDLKGEARLPQNLNDDRSRRSAVLDGEMRRSRWRKIAQPGPPEQPRPPSLLDAPSEEAPAGEIRGALDLRSWSDARPRRQLGRRGHCGMS
jgi:hypothetical protein